MIEVKDKMKLGCLFIILSCLIVSGCGNRKNKNIDAENAIDKRIEIFPEERNIPYEKPWHYEIPPRVNLSNWTSTDSTQSLYYPENMEAVDTFNSKRIMNVDAESSKLDDFISMPIIKHNIVYVKNNNSIVSAYSLESGKKIWSQHLSEDKKKLNFIGGGLSEENGIMYCSFGGNEIVALEAETGNEIWRARLSSIIRATPTYGYGKIFVRSLDNKFFILDAKNGSLLYVMDTGVESLVRASKATSVPYKNGTMLLSNSSGIISLIKDNEGESIWSANIAFYENPLRSIIMNDISMTPVIRKNIVYAASQIGTLTAIDIGTGNLRWNHVIHGIENVWIAGDGLFIIDDTNDLWHLNAYSGLARWKVKLPDLLGKLYRGGRFYGPTMINGNLFIATSFGKLLEVSPKNGELITTHEIPVEKSSIPIAINGKVLILSASGKLTILSSQ
jgi:outer membrane protein assembly factor BamB